MEQSVEQILGRRQRAGRQREQRLATAAACALHAAALIAALAWPYLGAKAAPPPQRFRVVEAVPLKALGVPDPPPARPRPKAPPVETPAPPPPKTKIEPPKAPPPDPKALTIKKPVPETPSERPPAPDPTVPEPLPARQGSETGRAEGTAAFGASVASLDNPDFTYSYYLDRMTALIRAHWHRPVAADGTEATLHFRILRDGSLSELTVRTASGDVTFDRAAYRAVLEAAPFPPLPAGYRQDSLGVSLIVQ